MLRVAAVLLLTACGSSAKPDPQQPTDRTPPTTQPAAKAGKSIGSATMLDDGTIQLMLRAEGEGGMVGDALISYPPTHGDYRMVFDHLGGMKPGDSKPVPPFPSR